MEMRCSTGVFVVVFEVTWREGHLVVGSTVFRSPLNTCKEVCMSETPVRYWIALYLSLAIKRSNRHDGKNIDLEH